MKLRNDENRREDQLGRNISNSWGLLKMHGQNEAKVKIIRRDQNLH